MPSTSHAPWRPPHDRSPTPSLRRLAVALALPLLVAACAGGGGDRGDPRSPAAVDRRPPSRRACPDRLPDQRSPRRSRAGETRTVTITTDKGDIVIEIKADLSPIAAGNFVALAECGYYDGVVFHRVVPGSSSRAATASTAARRTSTRPASGRAARRTRSRTSRSPRPTTAGTVAMARTAQPDSVGSQFFIVLDDAARPPLASAQHLPDHRRGHVGMEAADAIIVGRGRRRSSRATRSP